MKDIDPTKELSLEDFCELFEQVPLNENEREDIKTRYWALYLVLVDNDEVDPTQAWVATKNTFIAHETQIKERMES